MSFEMWPSSELSSGNEACHFTRVENSSNFIAQSTKCHQTRINLEVTIRNDQKTKETKKWISTVLLLVRIVTEHCFVQSVRVCVCAPVGAFSLALNTIDVFRAVFCFTTNCLCRTVNASCETTCLLYTKRLWTSHIPSLRCLLLIYLTWIYEKLRSFVFFLVLLFRMKILRKGFSLEKYWKFTQMELHAGDH